MMICIFLVACLLAAASSRDALLQRLQRGQSKAANATLLVGGLVRNAAPHLPLLRQKIESLAKHFAEVKIVFVENDSTDGTGKYLDSWARKSRAKVTVRSIRLRLSQDGRIGQYANRGELKAKGWGHDGVRLLARLRNLYLTELRKEADGCCADAGGSEKYWVLMIDVDVGVEWTESALMEAIGHETQWHVLCAHTWYRDSQLYDAFALRGNGLQALSPAVFEELSGRSFFPHAICGLQRSWGAHCACMSDRLVEDRVCACAATSAAPSLIPVNSCFGGLALYHQDLLHTFKGCQYDEGVDDCEHVALHSCMRSQKAVVALYPRLTARASAANSTCCIETCAQAESFPMAFLPFQPQFWRAASGLRVAGMLAAGMSSEEAGDLQAALEKYQQAARLPKGATVPEQRWAARAGLLGAFLLLQHKQADKAMQMLRSTGLLASADPWAAMIVGHVHELLDDLGGAAAWFEKALTLWAKAPTVLRQEERQGAWIKSRLAWLPATHASAQEAADAMQNFTAGLSHLVTHEGVAVTAIPAAFDTRAVEMTRLTYLGPVLVPHLPEMVSMYSRMHMRSLQNLGFEPESLQSSSVSAPNASWKVRVGFISGLFSDSAVGNLARGLIWPLPNSVWVALVSLGSLKRNSSKGHSAMVVDALVERADHVEETSYWGAASPGTANELSRTRTAILRLELNVIVYLEIGLDVRSFTLAHSRLAPLQMVTYGHASTTGIQVRRKNDFSFCVLKVCNQKPPCQV